MPPPWESELAAPPRKKTGCEKQSGQVCWDAGLVIGLFLYGLGCQPRPRQEIELASSQIKKQARKNKSGELEKNKLRIVFFELAPDGNLTIEFACPKGENLPKGESL